MKKLLYLLLIPVLVLSCTGTSGEIEPANVTLTVHTPQITVYGDAVPSEILFTCNGSWTVSSDNDWITFPVTSGKGSEQQQAISFVPGDNTSGTERVGLIEIVAKDCYEMIMVTQVPASANSISNFFKKVVADEFSKVYYCAHRANSWVGSYELCLPENSIPAIEECIKAGIEMVEIDVRKTKDGYLVCCHDGNINSVTNGSGNVADLTYAQIKSYDMKSRKKGVVFPGVKMPTLEEALLACKDKIWVNLDLSKTTISPSEIVNVLKKTGMLDQVTCYTGSDVDLGKTYYSVSDRLSIHLSISASGGVGSISGTKTVPLFQISTSKYWNGTEASTSLSEAIRRQNHCSFSNLLDYDSKVINGNLDALKAFRGARIDFLQTDVAGHPNVENYLKSEGLR